jgi:hypothetical protein
LVRESRIEKRLRSSSFAKSSSDTEACFASQSLEESFVMPSFRRVFTSVHHARITSAGGSSVVRPGLDPNAIIDVLYAPIYYRLQMGTGPLSDAYIDEIFDHAMKGLKRE